MAEQLSNVKAIKQFFKDVSMKELQDLNPEERQELGDLARAELSS